MKQKLNKAFQSAKSFYEERVQKPVEATTASRQIIIILEKNKSKADWFIRDALSNSAEFIRQGQLSELQPGENDKVLVIVPGQEVLLTQTPMPRLSSHRLQQALPFALEEQVLDEVETLHFVAGPYPSSTPSANEDPQNVPVAIVKKELMESWLQHLQEAGIQPDAILPEVFLLPYVENQWQLHLNQDKATLRTGLYAGFSSDVQSLETLLTLKLAEEARKPDKLLIYQDKNISLNLKSLSLNVETREVSPQQWLSLGAESLEKYPFINLLQAPYLSQRQMKIPEKNKNAWRLAAYALALWISILFLGKFGSWAILSFEHHHLQNIINETYQAHFPQSKTVLNPKAKFEAKLKKSLAQSDKSLFFQWLSDIAKVSSAVRLQSLNLQNNQLSLDVTASSFASLDDFILSLKENGVEVKQQNATLAGNQVKAILLITGKRS